MSEKCDRNKTGFHGLVIIAVAVGALVVAVGAATGKPGFGGHMGHWGHHGATTQEDMQDFSEFFVKRFSRRIDATDTQKAAIQKEFDSVIPKIMDLRERKNAAHKKVIAALGGETVDRAALEQARREAAALAEEAFGVVLQTTINAAEILTPAQRKELVAHIEKTHGS
ncbi:MAG: periplasmic heavy metal sensor [Nitrospinota bacterium]|nr:periplasmic heavy metal sensor [Nitrospinota bacterium]